MKLEDQFRDYDISTLLSQILDAKKHNYSIVNEEILGLFKLVEKVNVLLVVVPPAFVAVK